MKKQTLLASILLFFVTSAFAAAPLDKELPASYKSLRNSVYATNCSTATIDSLYDAAVAYAKETYEETDSEYWNLISMCDYMKGLDRYYKEIKKEAIKYLDLAISESKKSMDIKKCGSNITLYAKALFQRSYYDMSFALKWIPKIMSICDEAIAINPNYTAAYQMKYAILCYIPAPYGNYKEGAQKMLSLNDAKWAKEKDDYFSIAGAAGYALEKSGNKEAAKVQYAKALEYFPTNKAAKKAQADINK